MSTFRAPIHNNNGEVHLMCLQLFALFTKLEPKRLADPSLQKVSLHCETMPLVHIHGNQERGRRACATDIVELQELPFKNLTPDPDNSKGISTAKCLKEPQPRGQP